MLPAANRGVGVNIGFPDVCLTPVGAAVVPIPYPNFAAHAMATSFAATVLINGLNALTLGSTIPLTTGDEPGVAHPTVKGEGAFKTGSPIVTIEGLPAVSQLCATTGNNANDGLGAVLIPDAVNVFYSYAAGAAGEPAAPRAMGVAEIERYLAPLAASDRVGARPLEAGIGLIALGAFSADAPARIYDLVRGLEARGLRALILDLRGNPGGELEACVALAGDFLESGREILTIIDGDGDATVRCARGAPLYGFPLAILVDGGTASAAELLAGCLQAHGRAVVIGETTRGKGTAQRLLPPSEGTGSICATVARCVLPFGARLDGVGVRPCIEVTGSFAQLAAAVAALTDPSSV